MAASSSLPLVSIIVPVYNGESYVRESLDSILAQTYPNLEIMVLDDASTDNTPAILAEYAGRVELIRQPVNLGIYGNANMGIARAKGKYVAVYHSDDVYLPQMVEEEVAFLERYPEAGAVFTSLTFIGPDSRAFGHMDLPPEAQGNRPMDYRQIFNALLRYTNHLLMCPTAMVRASVHADVGVYNQPVYRNTADMEMWLRIARSYPVGVLEQRLLRYRHFHDSSSMRYHKLRTEPGRYFWIMDLDLDNGGRAVAEPDALAAHEAHRAQDLLMVTTSLYVRGDLEAARKMLDRVKWSALLGSGRIQRGRMLLLDLILRVATRLPRVPALADFFLRRWHAKTAPKPIEP